MNQRKYQLKAGDNFTTYEFLSEGTRGEILKIIQFSKTNYYDVFNLAFGDKDEFSGHIDDKVISNNGDSEMVLATVVSAFMPSLINILRYGFMQRVTLNQGHDFIEWELQNT